MCWPFHSVDVPWSTACAFLQFSALRSVESWQYTTVLRGSLWPAWARTLLKSNTLARVDTHPRLKLTPENCEVWSVLCGGASSGAPAASRVLKFLVNSFLPRGVVFPGPVPNTGASGMLL